MAEPSLTPILSEPSGDPWGEPSENESASDSDQDIENPWGDSDSNSDWLSLDETTEDSFDILNPFEHIQIPLGDWTETGLDIIVTNFRPAFQAIRTPIDFILTSVESGLLAFSPLVLIAIFSILSWQAANGKIAIGTFLSFATIGFIGVWPEAMITLALVLTSIFFSLIIGIPAGIWLSKSDNASAALRPILDAMQTTPAFVYLIPIVMLFGIGNVPGVAVTIIFALPPLIRLTNLGIRQVPEDLVEASKSFGSSPMQLLFKVQLPLAMPTIMAGVNQTLMLCLSMVVIASMIAVGGLGQLVLRGIGRLDMGLATVGGVGIVLLAIVLDRITQAMGTEKRVKGIRHWYDTGPVGLIRKLINKNR